MTYKTRGFTVARGAMPPDSARSLFDRALGRAGAAPLRSVDVVDPAGEARAGVGGRLRYDVGDADWCDANVPGIGLFYARAAELATRAAGEGVVTSPHGRSRYVFKLYPAGCGAQGWHYDTNGVTALLYLTDNEEGCTRVVGLDGEVYTVFPRAGDMLLMQGRRCWHRPDPVITEVKAVVPFNLYIAGDDTPRPANLDDLLYGAP